ncbi:MAG: DUF4091 domain-containing protein [Armatimonadetes bacterium]|nr:DUF4091 domain-containing protein [Armatimonadota bacterium]
MPRPLLACLLACLPLAAEPRGEVLPVLRCPPVAQPPTIDGRLDDPCWTQAVVSGPFVTPSGAAATYVTTVRLAHDAAKFYLAVECADPDPGKLVSAHTQRDSDVYLDDCVEVFVDGDLDFRTYHHFLVNPGNVQRDESGDLEGSPQYDVGWNQVWPSATRRTDKGWVVELALPLAPLGIPLTPEPVIGLNVCRSSATGGLSCLAPTHGGFHDPHRHAMVVLAQGAAPVAVEPGGLEPLLDASPGRHEATLAAPSGLKAEWRTYTGRGLRTSTFVTQPGSALSWDLGGAGSLNLCLILRDAAGQVVAVHNVVVQVPLVYNVALGHRLPAPSWLSLWWAESMHKVMPDRTAPPDRDEAAEMSCAGNEVEACQVVVRAQGGASVTVEPPLFRGPRASIPAGRVRLYRVACVNVDEPTDAYGGTGRYPDPLLPVTGSVPVAEGENTVLWVQVSVPKRQPRGRYEGALVLRAEGKEPVRVPIRLRVYGFDLTDETHTATAYGLGPDWEYLHVSDRAQQEEVFVKYLQAFREHRLSPYEPFAFHPMRYELLGQGEAITVSHDFADFDQAAARYLDEWKLNGFNFPAMPGSIAGHERFTPEYNRLHKLIYGPMTEHLREKGWLSKAYSYWYDEPEEAAYPYVVAGMDLLGRDCPGLTRLITEQIEPGLVGHVDLWCPVLSNYQPKLAPERQQRGELVWWYVCTGPRSPYPNNFIDHPGLHHRIRFWMMEKYGVTGSLYWATTYWRGKDSKLRNPWEAGMSVSPDGGYWGNGDGMLLYPACGEPAAAPCLDGPVVTQRIEILRDGLEDREYFWSLRQLVARALRMGGRATGRGRSTRVSQALSAAYEALGSPDRLAESLTQFDHDPAHLLAERAAMAEALEALTPALR